MEENKEIDLAKDIDEKRVLTEEDKKETQVENEE